MNRHLILGSGLAVTAASLFLLALRQHRRAGELRVILEAGAIQSSARNALTPSEAPRSEADRGEATLSEAEHLELLRLRGQIQPLLERHAALVTLSNRNVNLQAKLVAARATMNFPPPGYIRRADAQNRGALSPEAALETFLWAMQNQDTNVFFSVLNAKSRENMGHQLAQNGIEQFFKSQGGFPGARIVERKEVPPMGPC